MSKNNLTANYKGVKMTKEMKKAHKEARKNRRASRGKQWNFSE